MPSEMKIDAALADLEAGKFSFRMVDAIKNHVRRLEGELEVTRGLHASAVRELQLQEYANWRLESELKRSTARIRALVRANFLTKEAYRKMVPIAAEVGKYLSASLEFAGGGLKRAMANLKSGKFQSQIVDSLSRLNEFLRATWTWEETFGEMRRYAAKMGASLQVLEQHGASIIGRVTAYVSNSNKTSA